MSLHVIEGTWEEIKRHEAELTGRHLRVTFTSGRPATRKSDVPAQMAAGEHSPRVSAMGKYAGVLSSEDFMRQKQEEIDLEDRPRP